MLKKEDLEDDEEFAIEDWNDDDDRLIGGWVTRNVSVSLQDIVDFFIERNIDLNEVYPYYEEEVRVDDAFMLGYAEPFFHYTKEEADEDFEKRVKQYKKDLKNYKKWYNENKEEIKAEKARIREEKKRLKEEEKQNKKLEKLKKKKINYKRAYGVRKIVCQITGIL